VGIEPIAGPPQKAQKAQNRPRFSGGKDEIGKAETGARSLGLSFKFGSDRPRHF
jgi:hypothetical protein